MPCEQNINDETPPSQNISLNAKNLKRHVFKYDVYLIQKLYGGINA
jgi:hypothetical protein